MSQPYKLADHKCRFVKIFPLYSPEIPDELYYNPGAVPDLTDFPYPLPLAASKYTCEAYTSDGARWLGGEGGLTRVDLSAERENDRIMFFTVDRYLADDDVRALFADGEIIWALCKTSVSRIEMKKISCEEKAKLLTAESLRYVDRRGMISNQELDEPRDLDSVKGDTQSDNDGGFTAAFAVGETLKYAYLKRKLGAAAPETLDAKASAVRAGEACLLTLNISGRGDGFPARTYALRSEHVPDDGLFYQKQADGFAVCLDMRASRKRGVVGMKVKCDSPVPDRLAKLYRDLGYEDDDVIYKGDTSSDEVTLHFLNLWFMYDHLCFDDEELRSIVVSSCENLLNHIIDNGLVVRELDGKPTTWGRWDPEYFNTPIGWADACLNSAQILMYLNVAEHICGQKEKWTICRRQLIGKYHYDDLPLLHLDRFTHFSYAVGNNCDEEMMYGDNMLAVVAFYGLITLEKDPELKKKYIRCLRTWDHSLLREYNPGYRFLCMAADPDYPADMDGIAEWFYRLPVSRIASPMKLERADVPVRIGWGGMTKTGWLLEPDETAITKYDRDPWQLHPMSEGSVCSVESCYPYTFAYWFGKYNGYID
ncbi:MAG: hypothetical protein IJK23_13670 [Clostridia bacterium]|nr:hypothetical protein [Clostridia bacterium]